MSLILLNMKKEQLHRMVLSTFLLKMSLIYVALYLSKVDTISKRRALSTFDD